MTVEREFVALEPPPDGFVSVIVLSSPSSTATGSTRTVGSSTSDCPPCEPTGITMVGESSVSAGVCSVVEFARSTSARAARAACAAAAASCRAAAICSRAATACCSAAVVSARAACARLSAPAASSLATVRSTRAASSCRAAS